MNRSALRPIFWFGIVPLPILVSLLLQGSDRAAWFDNNISAALAYLVASAAVGLSASDLNVKMRESVAGLVQFGPSLACLVWWGADGLLVVAGVRFESRTIIVGNLIAALVCGFAWGLGHLSGRQIQDAESSREFLNDLKRSVMDRSHEIEHVARLHPRLSLGCRQTIRSLCNRLSSLPASRFEDVEAPRILAELLESLHDKDGSEEGIAAKIKQVERLTGTRFAANNNALRVEPADKTEQRA